MGTMVYNPTWWERGTNPDLVTRGLNVGAGSPVQAPDYNADDQAYNVTPMAPWMTVPAMRPSVQQRFLNFNIIAGTPAVPVSGGRLETIGLIFNVYSTAGASAFWGANGVTVTNGIEVRPGVPAPLLIEQVREQWELQRQLEHIGAMIAGATGNPGLGMYRAPKVIFDLSQIYVASVAALSVSIVAFLPPEDQ
jgi:hypothetical protein